MNIVFLKRFIYIFSLCTVITVLSACSEEEMDFTSLGTISTDDPTYVAQQLGKEVTVNYDLSKAPMGVQQGVITVEYFTLLMGLIDKISEYNDAGRRIADNIGLTDDEKREDRVELAQDILVYLNAFRYSPSNDIEREIHNYTIKVIVSTETLAEYRIKYNRGSTSYKQLILDTEQDAKANVDIWLKIMDNYDLFLK